MKQTVIGGIKVNIDFWGEYQKSPYSEHFSYSSFLFVCDIIFNSKKLRQSNIGKGKKFNLSKFAEVFSETICEKYEGLVTWTLNKKGFYSFKDLYYIFQELIRLKIIQLNSDDLVKEFLQEEYSFEERFPLPNEVEKKRLVVSKSFNKIDNR